MFEGIPKSLLDPSDTGDLPVSVVIPLFNEERILEENLVALARFFDQSLGPRKWLFILVDNGSIDATPKLIQAAVERWPLSRAIHVPEPNYGAALKAGMLAATTKWIFSLDIEQWDLPFCNWAWRHRNAYDVFIASKRADLTLNYQQPFRRLLSCGLNGLLQLFFGFTGTDTHGPKLLNRSAVLPILRLCQLDRGQFDTELVLRAMRGGKRIVEAPVEYRELRPTRNWMVKKIVWNILALRRLNRIMKDVPFQSPTRYYRFAREDVLAEGNELTTEARERSVV